MKPSWRACAALLTVLSLSGCYFTSENPLPKKPEMDRELLGWWEMVPDQKDPSAAGWAVFAADKDGWFQAVLLEKYYENPETYRGFCSEIKGEKYLNVKKVNILKEGRQAELDENFSLIHYRITGGKRLEMHMLNEALFKQAVKSRKLAGFLSPKEDDLNLTCTTEQLTDFLSRQKPKDLLGEPLRPMERTDKLPEREK